MNKELIASGLIVGVIVLLLEKGFFSEIGAGGNVVSSVISSSGSGSSTSIINSNTSGPTVNVVSNGSNGSNVNVNVSNNGSTVISSSSSVEEAASSGEASKGNHDLDEIELYLIGSSNDVLIIESESIPLRKDVTIAGSNLNRELAITKDQLLVINLLGEGNDIAIAPSVFSQVVVNEVGEGNSVRRMRR